MLWIIAVYPALQWAILSRLKVADVAGAPDGSDDAPAATNASESPPEDTSPMSP